MSNIKLLPRNAPPENSPIEQLSHHRLDLVRANAHLSEHTLPGISFHVNLWHHGTFDFSDDDQCVRALAHYGRLAPYVAGADYAGIELAICHYPVEKLLAQTAEFNAHSQDDLWLERYRPLTYTTGVMYSIARGLRARGVAVPEFFFIDMFASPSLVKNPSACDADTFFRRENLVIQQLWSKGLEVTNPHATKRIDAIIGSDHSFITPALRALGAQVTRAYVDPLFVSPLTFRTRCIRSRTRYIPDAMLCERAERLARDMLRVVRQTTGEAPLHDMPLIGKIGMFCLQGLRGQLPEARQRMFEAVSTGPAALDNMDTVKTLVATVAL